MISRQSLFKILKVLNKQRVVNIAILLGKDILNRDDLKTLRSSRMTKHISKDIPSSLKSYLFGKIVAPLDNQQISSLTKKDLTLFYEKNKDFFTPREKAEYFTVLDQSYSFANNFFRRFENEIEQKIKSFNRANAVIAESVVAKRGVNSLTQSLANTFESYNKDWARVADTELQRIHQNGSSAMLKQMWGEDVRVYKRVYPQACSHCKKLYLHNGQPKVFKLSDLIKNGSNVGKKVKDWLPTIDPIHPWCRCDLRYVHPDKEWDGKKFSFKKKNNINRKSKIQITIGEKTFEV